MPPPGPPAPAPPPASYTLAFTPESRLDASDVAYVTDMAKAQGWSNEQAQAALDELSRGLSTQRTTFRQELEAHPEVGGVNLARAQENALRVLDRFLPASDPLGKQLRDGLAKTGHEHWVPFRALLNRVGASMREDTPGGRPVVGGGAGRRDTADVMFGDMATPAPK